MKKLLLLLLIGLVLAIPKPAPAVSYSPVYNLKSSTFKALYPPQDTETARLPFSVRDLTYSPNAFRLFIPPGTIRVVINFYLFNGSKDISFAVRYQQPPRCAYCGCAGKEEVYDGIPWVSDVPRMGDVTQGDVYTENLNGISNILKFNSSTPLTVDKAGWLYIKKMPFTTSTIRDIAVDIKVNSAAYKAWYNNVAWVNGNPPGAATGTIPACPLSGSATGEPVATQPTTSPTNPLVDLLHPQPEPQPQLTGVYVATINNIPVKLALGDKAVITLQEQSYVFDYVIDGCVFTLSSDEYGMLKLLKYGQNLTLITNESIIFRRAGE